MKRFYPILIGFMIALFASQPYSQTLTQDSSLRELAEACGIQIGAAVRPLSLAQDPQYAETLAREFNIITAESAMKFHALQPQRGQFNFEPADALVAFADEHDMELRGHTLLWHQSAPRWLRQGNWTRDELVEILREHIHTVVNHFKGKVKVWDVVNEAIDTEQDDGYRRSIWYDTIGPEYVDLAFRFAHEADPDLKLYYNDYSGEGMGKKSDAIYDLVEGMLQRGVPVHGVGLQMHIRLYGDPEAFEVIANNHRLGKLGLETQITEIDVRIDEPFLPEKFDRQAYRYRKMMQACLESPNCKAYILWGFTDKYSWIPRFFDKHGAALIFDENFEPKPAYFSLKEIMLNHLQK